MVERDPVLPNSGMIDRLNDSYRTELEPEEYNPRQHGAVGITRDALEAYACRICHSSRRP